jgi:hypothetical protein
MAASDSGALDTSCYLPDDSWSDADLETLLDAVLHLSDLNLVHRYAAFSQPYDLEAITAQWFHLLHNRGHATSVAERLARRADPFFDRRCGPVTALPEADDHQLNAAILEGIQAQRKTRLHAPSAVPGSADVSGVAAPSPFLLNLHDLAKHLRDLGQFPSSETEPEALLRRIERIKAGEVAEDSARVAAIAASLRHGAIDPLLFADDSLLPYAPLPAVQAEIAARSRAVPFSPPPLLTDADAHAAAIKASVSGERPRSQLASLAAAAILERELVTDELRLGPTLVPSLLRPSGTGGTSGSLVAVLRAEFGSWVLSSARTQLTFGASSECDIDLSCAVDITSGAQVSRVAGAVVFHPDLRAVICYNTGSQPFSVGNVVLRRNQMVRLVTGCVLAFGTSDPSKGTVALWFDAPHLKGAGLAPPPPKKRKAPGPAGNEPANKRSVKKR